MTLATHTSEAVTPALAALIADHDRANAALEASENDPAPNDALVAAAGALRSRVMAFRSRGLSDSLAKAASIARVYPPEDIEAEIRLALSGHAYLDEVWVSLAVELMKAAQGKPVA